MKYLAGYLVLMNLLAFILMALDKSRARRGAWRIPERTLFLSAIFGGSIGAIVGMQCFRHKTRHRSFVWGMPLILTLQLVLAALLLWKFGRFGALACIGIRTSFSACACFHPG